MKNVFDNNIIVLKKNAKNISNLLLVIIILICITLSGCNRIKETVFENTVCPRSMYDELNRYIYNDYTGIDIFLPDEWNAENNANAFAYRANFSKEQKELLQSFSYEKVSLIPDFTMENSENRDTITVFYRNLSTEEYFGMNSEDFIKKYISYYSGKNSSIRGHNLFKQQYYPNSNQPVYEKYYYARESGSVVIDDIVFTLVLVDAPYRSKNSYEYAAFADYEDYVICIVAATDCGTSADEFWKIINE